MAIEYTEIDVPAKKTRRGGETIILPAHRCLKVVAPHTIWHLARQRKKERRNEFHFGVHVANQIKRGLMKVDGNGDVVELDPYGVKPPQPVGVTGRIMTYLKRKFGFY